MRTLTAFLMLCGMAAAQTFPDGGSGSGGTVLSVAILGIANQITATGTCSGTTTISCTLSIPSGFVLPGTIDGLTITTTTGTLTIAGAKVLTVNKSITLDGTDGVTITFPVTSATMARTDAGQTFTGVQNFSSSPTMPTVSQSDNSTKGATTAYVDAGLATKGAGTVTSGACGVTGTVTVTGATPPVAHNGSYAIVTTDCGVPLSTNVAAAWTLPACGSAGFASGWWVPVNNVGSGSLTITATTSTFYGGPTANISGGGSVLTVTAGTGIPSIRCDGSLYQVLSGGGGAASTTVTISTSCPVTVGASTGDYYNNAAGACTYNLPTITAGMIGATVLCFRNYTGKSGVITLQAPASTFIDQLGVNGSSAGTLVSPASLGVAACLKIASTTQYMASPSTPAAWAGN